ncbi:acetyltransferase [Ferrovibrio terrae]|uniref:acetyltransferase n=1 Tax=Ferrovibrio terrae TaxID=2594003 RepID=UPI00313787C1
MDKTKDLVIVGDGEFGEIAYEYFTHDSDFRVVGFAAERAFLIKDRMYDLPVVALEDIETQFPPDRCLAHVAVTYTKLNRVRARLCGIARAKGYVLANYVSSRAFVWRNVTLGDNVFIFENNVIQHHVRIGSGVVLWSGNHIGHRSAINDYCFVSSHVMIPGYCEIGSHSFMGVNATLADHVKIGRDNWIGAASVILKNTEDNQLFGVEATPPSKVPARRYFKVPDDSAT